MILMLAQNSKFITKNRYRLVKLQNSVNSFFKIFGLDVLIDLNYHGSYLVGGESIPNRIDLETAKKDVRVLKKYVNRDSVVLDIGCGCGRIEKTLSYYCREIHGVDISSIAIRKARKFVNKSNAHFHVGDNLKMFKDDMFDFIFEIATFHHMSREDFYRYLLDVFRVLKPEGRFLFTFNDLTNGKDFDYFAYNAVVGNRSSLRMRYYNEQEIKNMLRRVGFWNIRIKPWKNRWDGYCVKRVVVMK